MIEILAPAGDKQCALAAINAGADAIYLGLTDFSARSSAKNFSGEEFAEISALARLFGVKVYVAMNTLVKQEELENFVKTAVDVHNAGADALILQDVYLGAYLKKTYSQLVLHLSTQAGICNEYGARLAKECGFSRVIAARETSLDDLKNISSVIQTESFVQGALCTCFSGQCYFSSFAGGNSGNRGKCKQPCRKRYRIDRAGHEEFSYALSLSDLSVGGDVEKYVRAGVSSFKIEGRMRRSEYVAAAVKYYKKLLGGGKVEEELSALKRTYNRGNYTKGLAFGQDKTLISSAVQGHIGEFAGVISVVNGKYLCGSGIKAGEGDCFKILRGGKELCGAAYDGAGKGGFYLSSNTRLKNGDKAFITTDCALNESLLSGGRKLPVKVSVRVAEGERIKADVNGVEYLSDFSADRAQSRAVTRGDVEKCFCKTDSYPFDITFGDIEIVGQPFVPVSAMNALRRSAYAGYFALKSASRNIAIAKTHSLPANAIGNSGGKPYNKSNNPDGKPYNKSNNFVVANRKTAVIARDLSGLKADIGILKPDNYFEDLLPKINFGGEKFIYLPPFLKGEEIEAIKGAIKPFDGIYCDGNYAVELAKELNKKLFAGTGFNLSNSVSLSFLPADYFAISKELSSREAQPLLRENAFYLTAGDVKLMDLIYCPFSKTCSKCDKREFYTLTDEDNRQFTLRRYSLDDCRFELFNCDKLIGSDCGANALYDFTCDIDPSCALAMSYDAEKLKKRYPRHTKGHAENPVL